MAVEGGIDEGDGEGAVRGKEIIKLWSAEGKERRKKKKDYQGEIHPLDEAELKKDR